MAAALFGGLQPKGVVMELFVSVLIAVTVAVAFNATAIFISRSVGKKNDDNPGKD